MLRLEPLLVRRISWIAPQHVTNLVTQLSRRPLLEKIDTRTIAPSYDVFVFALGPQAQVGEELGCDFELESSVPLFRCLLAFDGVARADFV